MEFLGITFVFLEPLWCSWAVSGGSGNRGLHRSCSQLKLAPNLSTRTTEQMGSSSESSDPLPATDIGSDLGQPLPFKGADFTLLSQCSLLCNPWKSFSAHATPGAVESGRERALLCTCSWIRRVFIPQTKHLLCGEPGPGAMKHHHS